MPQIPWRLVTVDIDGTLTLVHGWGEIARAFGRYDAFEETTRRYSAHEIGEDEHLTNLINLADGHTVAEVEEVLTRTPKLSGISEGVAELHADGAWVALLSHNPTYVADWYRRTFGFDDFEAVAGQPVTDGRIGYSTRVRADKPGGMRVLLLRYDVPASVAVHVGDGPSDAEVFRMVGGGVALNSSDPEVRREADLVLTTQDFRDVAQGIERLQPRK